MREAGCEVEAVVVKSDSEPALVKVVEEIGRLRAARGGRGMVVEHSPVHSSKSNGIIERTIQRLQGIIRTWRSAVEDKWGVKLEAEHRIWPWLVEAVGWTMTRAEVGKDGKTAFERIRGKQCTSQVADFGECIRYRSLKETGAGETSSRQGGEMESGWVFVNDRIKSTSKQRRAHFGQRT